MNKFKSVWLWSVGIIFLFGGVQVAQGVPEPSALLGPSSYECFDATGMAAIQQSFTGTCNSDSPFAAEFLAGNFSYFHLEDFEDGMQNTPGVTPDAGNVLTPATPSVDSVDADDGVVNGSGSGGHSWFFETGTTGVTWIFDQTVLGAFPTHVGIVWTDGNNNIQFEAFDAMGASLGTRDGSHADNSFFGETAEDRFYGVIDSSGISKITLRSGISGGGGNGGGGIEMDHLQYGRQRVPFAAFTIQEAKVKFHRSTGARDRFEIKGEFTTDGIDPVDEDVVVTVGTSFLAIEDGFVAVGSGFEFEGTVDGAQVKMKIKNTHADVFKFKVKARWVDLTGTANPVEIMLRIGDDVGALPGCGWRGSWSLRRKRTRRMTEVVRPPGQPLRLN